MTIILYHDLVYSANNYEYVFFKKDLTALKKYVIIIMYKYILQYTERKTGFTRIIQSVTEVFYYDRQ